MERLLYQWHCNNKIISLGQKTLVMGILNTTPDSFSDGGLYDTKEKALQQAAKMVSDGASIIDVGGESSRPGALPVDSIEEVKRTEPIINLIRKEFPEILISIDTTKSIVAQKAMDSGADIINDISSMTLDPEMKRTAANCNAGIILMHMQGSPKDMQINPEYKNVILEVKNSLIQSSYEVINAGINKKSIVIDPGIGFGKNLGQNLSLLKSLNKLSDEHPILVGLSRKSFIGSLLNKENPNDRLSGSLAANAFSIMQGAHIIRTHDVLETCDLCKIMDNLLIEEN